MTTLTYRGIQFEQSTDSIEVSTIGVSGAYRGRKTSFNQSTAAPAKMGTQLQFKGALYTA